MDDQARRFAALAVRVGRGITRIERDRVCCGSLTLQQFTTLSAIDAAGVITTSALAAELGVDLSTASRNLGVLERERLIARRRGAADARVVTVELTAEGREALATLACDARDVFASLFARVPAAKRAAVVAALDDLARALAGEPAEAACCSGPCGDPSPR